MAEYTAIVEAANAFVELLRANLSPEPVEKPEQIAMLSPFEPEDNQLTVHLFHIEEDPQNNKSGFYQESRTIQRKHGTVFQLYFLITPHSKAPAQLREADLQRIAGKTVQVIKDNSVIDEKYISGSLKSTGAVLKLVLQKPSYEQMIKIWNNTSVPYTLSLVCQLSGVSIDSGVARSAARVRDAAFNVEEKERAK